MKIAVIELEGHAECLYSFCKIFEDYTPKITIFGTQAIYNELQNAINVAAFEWILQPAEQAIKTFLATQTPLLNQYDVVLLNTVQKQLHQYYTQAIRPPKILRIHNTNTFLNRWSNIRFSASPYALWKDFSYVIRELLLQGEWQQVKKMIQWVDLLTFPTATIEQYALKNSTLAQQKYFPSIPLSCSSFDFIKTTPTNIRYLTITGTIDERRKDYELVVQVFKELLPNIQQPLYLTLLGKPKGPYGQRIINQLHNLSQTYELFQLRTYQKRVPQHEFNTVMQQTDLLLAPIRLNTRYKIYHEQYGYTKISGSESDVIRYGKAAIFPADYPIENEMKTLVKTYGSMQDLSLLLLKFVNNPEAFQTKEAQYYLEKQSPKQLQKQILQHFQHHILKH